LSDESSNQGLFVEEEKEKEKQPWEESSSSGSESQSGSEEDEESNSDNSGDVTSTKSSYQNDENEHDGGDDDNDDIDEEDSEEDKNNEDEDDGDEDDDDDESKDVEAERESADGKGNKFWEQNPEIYGIRRSSRARKEPERLTIKLKEPSDSDSDHRSRSRRKKKKQQKLSSSSWPTLSSGSDSESSSDYQQRQKPRPAQKKRRFAKVNSRSRKKPSSSSAGDLGYLSSDDDKDSRKASRRAASNVSYKEHSDATTDEDDVITATDSKVPDIPDDAETIEKVLTHRYGKPGVIGAMTTMYAPEAKELLTAALPDPKTEPVELQFFIKWKNWAHIHNTWETEKSLEEQKVKGMKKLANYIKRMNEIDNWKRLASPEDVEYFEYQQELHEEILDEYKIVERIIGHHYNDDSKSACPDYVCKWQGLPYSEASTEDGSLIARFFQESIDNYLNRERATTIPNRNAKVLRSRPKFVQIKKQPSYMGGSGNLLLRDYQLGGINWLVHAWCKNNSVILADEMGLGKTIQTICFLSNLFHNYELYGPYLIVVPLSTMASWQREFQMWAPDMNVVVYIGDASSRAKIKEYDWCHSNRRLKMNCVLTTYEMLLKEKELLGSVCWAALIVDEAHRLKNDDSLLYRTLVEFRTNFRLLITGTPLQNSLKELWSLLHFIMPDRFPQWEEFEMQYSTSQMKDGYQKLHRELEPFLLRRIKKDVEKSLPSKVEQILRIEMSGIQKQYYKWILTKNYKELSKGVKGSISGFLNIVVELKKCCNHANLIRLADSAFSQDALQVLIKGSGKMVLLDKLLTRLKERGHRVLIFSQMVRMLDIIADYLALKRFQFQRLDGSIRGDKRKQALDHFNAEGSQDFCFLLSTRAGGLGVNLATADVVIIFDSDWNPQNDLQAMARAHRIGQTKQVKIYRLITKGSIEEDIIERAKKKMVLDHLIIQRMDTTGKKVLNKTGPSSSTPFNREELAAILKFGAEELFKETDNEQDQKLQAMDIDDILESAETRDSENHPSTAGDDLLSQFKVANFGIAEEDDEMETPAAEMTEGKDEEKTWDEIIPEVERKKAIEEEEQKKRMELYLPPRKRKTVTKMNVHHSHVKEGKKTRKSKAHTDSSSREESDGGGTETPKRKRGRPRTVKRNDVEGFTDSEVRRFIKSYKKFARPITRLDDIAADAELQEKSVADLKNLATMLHDGCEKATKEYQEKLVSDPTFDGKKRGASFKISGVSINAASVLKHEEDLDPLALCIPTDPIQRKQYRLTIPTRSVHWGIKWEAVDDSMLLVGVYQYGIDNWDAIKSDITLGLSNRILLPGNLKPQDKHLRSRAEYLLKLLKMHCNEHQDVHVKKRKPKEKKRKVQKDSAKVSENNLSAVEPAQQHQPHQNPHHHITYQHHQHAAESEDSSFSSFSHNAHVAENEAFEVALDSHNETGQETKKKTKEIKEKKKHTKDEKEKSKAKLKVTKHVHEEKPPILNEDSFSHFSQSSITINEIADMSKETFTQCKEKMRSVKKALRMLENPEENMPEKDQVNSTRQCLLKIGDHIQKCLDGYSDEELAKQWRSNLWTFVSKFTAYDASKLFKLYRIACRKRDDQRDERRKSEKKQPQHVTAQQHQHQQSPHQHQHTPHHQQHNPHHQQQTPHHQQYPLHHQQQTPHQQQHPPHHHHHHHLTPNLLELDEVRKRTLGIAIPSPSGKIPKIEKAPVKDRIPKHSDVRSPGYVRYDDRHEYNKGHRRRERSRSPMSSPSYRHHEKEHARNDHRHRDDRARDYDDRPRDYEDRTHDYEERARDSRHQGSHHRDYWEKDKDRYRSSYHSSVDSKWGRDSHRHDVKNWEKDRDYGDGDFQGSKYTKKDNVHRVSSDKRGSPKKKDYIPD